MAFGVRLVAADGEELQMPGWSLNLETKPPCVFKGGKKIDLPWKGLEVKVTNEELADIRRQYELAESP
ncbi:hypothetical protein GTQ41_16795 [Pseudomonas sp. AN-B15]|uniref:hypothetical protein n=1 Tax=Pseudomonas sp. AN-B15 TaxID=2697023 RepID=UPI001C2C316A|nr:hypothetical protein [Pseudomonas sp. AN-B15]QXE10648.1 hypothetical protein GTQ41_16795 [Pseudomonas sp. AN-B15]